MPDKIQEPLTKDMPHPMQPIGWDGHGVIRFKRNAIVDTLLDECRKLGGIDLNDIAEDVQSGKFSVDDQIQLAQLIGYSVSGFGDLSYVPEGIVAQADNEADRVAGTFTDPEPQDIGEAGGPFRSIIRMMASLNLPDDRPLRDVLPGAHPTWGEFKAFMAAVDNREPTVASMLEQPDLRKRCDQMLAQLGASFRGAGDGSIVRVNVTKMVDRLFGFVIAEIGRSASTTFDKSAPLCLYFEDDAEREAFIEVFKEAKPNVVTRKFP